MADVAPTDPVLTVYDEEHVITYLRMLDADAEGADWREVAQLVLKIDQSLSMIAQGVRSIPIWLVRNG